MRYLTKQIVFQELPDEISLSFLITGCPIRCSGCHSADTWSALKGKVLGVAELAQILLEHKPWITAVLFMGGEWEEEELVSLLKLVRVQGLKTGLYTGAETVSAILMEQLDYLKTGPYLQELGGLQSPMSNQRLYNLSTGEILNYRFYKKQQQEIEL